MEVGDAGRVSFIGSAEEFSDGRFQLFSAQFFVLGHNVPFTVHKQLVGKVLEIELVRDETAEPILHPGVNPGHFEPFFPEVAELFGGLVEGKTHDRKTAVLVQRMNACHFRQFFHAGRTPGRPEIDEIQRPQEALVRHETGRIVETDEGKCRNRMLRLGVLRDSGEKDEEKCDVFQ
jgi:hypothetical protein